MLLNNESLHHPRPVRQVTTSTPCWRPRGSAVTKRTPERTFDPATQAGGPRRNQPRQRLVCSRRDRGRLDYRRRRSRRNPRRAVYRHAVFLALAVRREETGLRGKEENRTGQHMVERAARRRLPQRPRILANEQRKSSVRARRDRPHSSRRRWADALPSDPVRQGQPPHRRDFPPETFGQAHPRRRWADETSASVRNAHRHHDGNPHGGA